MPILTDWDPKATRDKEAPRSDFDMNGDGGLTAVDVAFANFKVLVTNADDSATAKPLAQLGITEINLTADSTRIELPDGPVIEGQTTFRKSDSSTDANGNRVAVSTTYGAAGNTCPPIFTYTRRQICLKKTSA